MLACLRRCAFAILAWTCLALAIGCSSSDGEDGDSASDPEALGAHQVHIAPGIELAQQLALPSSASTTDKQRASVHFGNAYWLARFSMLSYWHDNEAGLRSTLTGWGFDGKNTRIFSNTCTGGYALYVPTNGLALVVFRGTLDFNDWLVDFKSPKVPWAGSGLVHWGFLSRFHSLWNADPACGMSEGLGSYITSRHTPDASGKTSGGALYITGHSLGASLATLALGHLQVQSPKVHVAALYTYGSPRVGNQAFAYSIGDTARGKTAIFRVVNANDIVTGVPIDLDPVEALYSDYRHVGTTGDPESVFQIWVKDRQLEISEDLTHIKYAWDDHLGYEAPLELQAKAHNQLH